ncbi:MAG: hypothetical protein HY574_04320 [candidate division NC10 bacterium]|nr:hypothetical protein [candidate division NC10 bacterium]
MQVKLRFKCVILIILAVWLTAAWSCSEVTSAQASLREKRLRDRITLVWSYFVKGNFEAYVAIWSARMRPDFRESEEEWQRNLRDWKMFLSREKPTSELLAVEIVGLRARAKMRLTTLEPDGSRYEDISYDYWVFESDDWFLDDAGRTD